MLFYNPIPFIGDKSVVAQDSKQVFSMLGSIFVAYSLRLIQKWRFVLLNKKENVAISSNRQELVVSHKTVSMCLGEDQT